MRVKSGFFNSKNQDRVYDASDFGKIFDGIINDGVYGTIGDKFMVSPAGGLSVNVATGRAWFNHVWVLNDSTITLTLLGNATTLPRIDAVIFEVNTTEQVRATEITTIQGTPAASPQRPAVVSEGGVYRYPIAYIRVDGNDPIIDAGDITYVVGTDACPIITAPLQVSSFEQWLTQWTDEFYTWFTHLHNELDEHQAANLQNQIDELSAEVEEVVSSTDRWIENFTLSVSGWSSNRYSLEPSYPARQYEILDVLPSHSSTEAQLKAWGRAKCGGHNMAGETASDPKDEKNIIVARGEVPTVSINVDILIRPRGGES